MTLGWLTAGERYPAPGRVRMSLEQAEAEFVLDAFWADSRTRPALWQGLERYLARFVRVEEAHAGVLAGAALVPFVWLGGSFVSSSVDPRNIDVTVALDDVGRRAVKGLPGTAWLTEAFTRVSVERDYLLSPLELPYRRVASAFKSHELAAEEQDYFRERGAWDDWWQRLRDPANPDARPSVDTAVAARGYVEVAL